MKVCLLNDSFPPVIDGVANVVTNYAHILTAKHGAEVMVGTPRYPDADYDNYPFQVVPYRSFDTTKIVKGYRAGNPLAVRSAKRMIDFQPDIIHSHCPVSSNVLARLVRNETSAPVVFTYHTKFDVDIARAVKDKFLQQESIKVLVNTISACDEVWCVSEGAGENLKSLGYEGEYRVVSNGVDFEKGMASEEAIKEATGDYDLPENVPLFLFVGRMMAYKGIPLILDALKMLKEKDIDFRMVFVGKGADLDGFIATAEEYGISDKVFFTGAIYDREALRAWNTRADLFVFPSTYDTNGIVVREAAACGLASALIRNSCAAEGITDDRNGFIIDENAESLAELLTRVSKDLDHARKVGENAMNEIYISWEDAVSDAYDRYGEILEDVRAGKMEIRRKTMTDHMLDATADFINKTDKILNIPRKTFEGMIDNTMEMVDYIIDAQERRNEELRSIFDSAEQSMAEMYEKQERMTDSIRKGFKEVIDDAKRLV
ncbi:Glycosyltransferase involved in cell wall bisynthesis [Lachnospiraceae bacterium]|nr:Glycosyltransferase involved in cell wall bisynthesis [Lachnospiraceae bacterium]